MTLGFLAQTACPGSALALQSSDQRWERIDRHISVGFRELPVERLWESAESSSVQLLGVFVGENPVQPGPPGTRGILVLPEEGGLASDGRVVAAAEARVVRHLGPSFRVAAGVHVASRSPRGADELALTEAECAWVGDQHRVGLGRSQLRWGAGATGSLLLGATAPPRWQLRWRTERALAVPSFGWRALEASTWSGSAFLAYLDDADRPIADPLLLGHRLSFQPVSWLELTGTRTILFGGEGRTGRLDPGAILDILLVRGENLRGERPPSDSDQRASFEVRLRPSVHRVHPRWDALEFFWEYAGEDVNDPPLPSAAAHQWGLLTRVQAWTLFVEGMETVTGRNRWYDHVVYGREAYTYRGFLLGHPLGGDARLFEVGVWSPPGPVRARLSWRDEAFGFHRPPREDRHRLGADVRFALAPQWIGECAYERGWREGGSASRAPAWVAHRGEVRLTWRR